MPARRPTSVPIESYHAHETEIALVMSHFFIGYLHDLYEHFERDLALVLVLGEIAHHNLASHFSHAAGSDAESLRHLETDEALRTRLHACNAYSLASATGMPRETIRRKIARLEELGWVKRNRKGEVCVTQQVGRHFHPDFNLNLLEKLLQTTDRLRQILSTTPAPTTP